MPAQPIHLGRLVAYMAQVSNSSNSWAIADVANATGISKDTVRRLFESNTDLFYCAPKVKGPAEYFYVPSERGQRIIDKAHTAHLGAEVSKPITFTPSTIPDKRAPSSVNSPVAKPLTADPLRAQPLTAEVKQYVDVGLETTVNAVLAGWNDGRAPHQTTDLELLTKTRNACEAIVHMISERIKELT